MHETAALDSLVAALNAQRGSLGDAAVDDAIAALRRGAGAKASAAAADEAVRLRQVSILFCDIVDSTAMLQIVAPEEALELVGTALRRFGRLVDAAGGEVLRYTGDGLKAAFGSKFTREDDAARAVEAGLAILEAAHEHASWLRRTHAVAQFAIRVGVNTGDVVLGGGAEADRSAMGHAVHVGARLEQAARPGQLLIGERTWALVRGRFRVEAQPARIVKGVDAPLTSYAVLGALPRAFEVAGRGIEGVVTQMIGRDEQLQALQDAYKKVFEPGATIQGVMVVAQAGVGKSRLLREFERWAGATGQAYSLLKARATRQTLGRPYALLRDLLGAHLQILDGDSMDEAKRKLEAGLLPLFAAAGEEAIAQVQRLGKLIGLDYGSSGGLADTDALMLRNSGCRAAVRMLEHLAAQRPLLLLLDDVHWGDEGSLDFLEHLLQAGARLPLLMIVLARPELLERRPSWAQGLQRIMLEPLAAHDSLRLADELLQRIAQVPEVLRTLVAQRGEGNPFFMEELVKMLIDRGAIELGAGDTGSGGKAAVETRTSEMGPVAGPWQVHTERLQALSVPATLAGVLQARLDQLPAEQRHALQLASVIGQHFWVETLAHVEASADGHLQPLAQRELVYRREASVAALHEYAFKHQILHQVTYETVLARVKRRVHARTAEWLVLHSQKFGKSLLASAAEHYEKAGDLANAVELYAQAVDHMQAIFANDAAIECVSRALGLINEALPNAAPLRWRLLNTRVLVHDRLGRRQEQLRDIEALQELAQTMPAHDIRRAEVAWLRGDLAMRTGDLATAGRELRRSMELGEQAGNEKLALRALNHLSVILVQSWMFHEAESLANAGLQRAQALGDAMTEAQVRVSRGFICNWRSDSGAALQEFLEALRLFRQARNVHGIAMTLRNAGTVYIRLGQVSLARRSLLDAIERFRAQGTRLGECASLGSLAIVEWRGGDFRSALRYALESSSIAKCVHAPAHLTLAEHMTGYASLSLGDFGEAADAFARAEALGREQGFPPVVLDAMCGLAQVAMARNDLEHARQIAEQMLQVAETAGAGGRRNGFAGLTEHLTRLTLYRIWDACGDPRAKPMLIEAHSVLIEAAGRIREPALRQTFLEMEEHRAILALRAKLD